MVLLDEQKKRIRELYIKHGSDGASSYEEFRGQYEEVSEIQFFDYWRAHKSKLKAAKPQRIQCRVGRAPNHRYQFHMSPEAV